MGASTSTDGNVNAPGVVCSVARVITLSSVLPWYWWAFLWFLCSALCPLSLCKYCTISYMTGYEFLGEEGAVFMFVSPVRLMQRDHWMVSHPVCSLLSLRPLTRVPATVLFLQEASVPCAHPAPSRLVLEGLFDLNHFSKLCSPAVILTRH